MGNQLPVYNSSSITRNPDRIWGSKYVVKRSSHQFYQTPIKTRNGLGALVQSDDKFGITHFSSALSGSATFFDIRSHIANEAIIVFGLGSYDAYNTHWPQRT